MDALYPIKFHIEHRRVVIGGTIEFPENQHTMNAIRVKVKKGLINLSHGPVDRNTRGESIEMKEYKTTLPVKCDSVNTDNLVDSLIVPAIKDVILDNDFTIIHIYSARFFVCDYHPGESTTVSLRMWGE